MGKFYELFHMDAVVGVSELNILYMKVATTQSHYTVPPHHATTPCHYTISPHHATTPFLSYHFHHTIIITPSSLHHPHHTIIITPSSLHHPHHTLPITPSLSHHGMIHAFQSFHHNAGYFAYYGILHFADRPSH